MHLALVLRLPDHARHDRVEEGDQLGVQERKYQVLLVYRFLLLHELLRQGQQEEVKHNQERQEDRNYQPILPFLYFLRPHV